MDGMTSIQFYLEFFSLKPLHVLNLVQNGMSTSGRKQEYSRKPIFLLFCVNSS